MTFQITNKIEFCDLDYNNTSFHNGLFYCVAVRLKPTLCPSEIWFSVFREQLKMRCFGEVEIVRGESFFIFKLSINGVGFYEAKSAIKSIISVTKLTNKKLNHSQESQELKAPDFSDDLSPLFFDSFMEIISHEG
ncbi:TPA: hypothetical protein LN225_004632 [Salmonella enterica subsp. enterica serovar Agona]|nr:hypothetical protein [Salmonella enterica subsp. enterica serovar Agona]